MSELEIIVEEPDQLDEFNYEDNSEKQRETFEDLKRAEESVAPNGSEDQLTAPQPIHFKAAGFVIQPINVEAALRALDSLCEGDPEEQRETFEYLKRALNETRAANGERLLFPDE